MSEVEATVPVRTDDSPLWIREAIDATVGEAKQWFETFRECLLHPFRFTNDWIDGRSTAMNPVGFLATSAGVLGVIRSFGLLLIGFERAETLAEQVWESITPFLNYISLGALAHIVLFPLSPFKRKASSTAAITMYAAGSAGALGEAIAWLIISALSLSGIKLPLQVVGGILGIALGAFCYLLGFGLGALHHSKWWHMILAFTLAFVVSGLFYGHFDPPGEYGVHWVLRIFKNGEFRPFLRLGF